MRNVDDPVLYNKIPGPKMNPILGCLKEYVNDPIEFITGQEKKYGGISYFRLANIPFVFITDPEHIRYVLHDNAKNYYKGKKYGELVAVFGDGLLTSEKKEWAWRRNMSSAAFNKKSLENYVKPMCRSVEILAEKWEAYKDGREFDMFNEMNELALDIAGRTMFGMGLYDYAPGASKILSYLLTAAEKRIGGLPLPLWVPTPENIKVNRYKKELQSILSHIIQKGKEDYDRGERKGNLLETFFEYAKDGKNKNNWKIMEEAAVFLVAGHETTGSGLTWAWCLLAQHPEVFDKIRDEAKKVLKGNLPEIDDLNKLPYTLSVIHESLRLYPAVWSYSRTAIENDEIGEYPIKKGTNIYISPFISHRSERFWDDPLKFDPERFSEKNRDKINPYVYIPFGSGPRTCIGNNFALQEMLVTLSYLSQTYKPQMMEGFEPRPVATVTMRPRGGMKMHL